MLEALLYIVLAVATVIAVILILATQRPDTFSVERSATINAPPERIFPLIADLHAFNRWNPFLKKDPATKLTYSGPASGTGAAHSWDGNSNVGRGSVEVTEVSAPTKVVMRLEMVKPIAAHNRVVFTLTPAASGTTVTWAMSGKQPLMAKAMAMFINCDKMVGGEFQKGLADLQVIAEG